MEIDWDRISSPEARRFLGQHLQQRRIIADFYRLLPDEAYDSRLVDRADRRADSPRESLAHILAAQTVYMRGAHTGRLSFEGGEAERVRCLSRQEALAESARLGEELYNLLSRDDFDPYAPVETPWGQESALSTLYLIRDHDILHVGWNLAIMDQLGMARFPSLRDYWG